jgi:hypothetical protein
LNSPEKSAPAAALVYVALSLALTWPLAAGLASNVPGDLGDSLLNMWILAWGAEHVPQLLTGGISWTQFWNGNIFYPEPLSLALSEHLFGQTLQILPVYWLTGNIILCYNLLFISTFALSAFGTYLLVRDLTGSARAGFIAGLIYGFLPYRIASVPHLQVMSSQWMPLALYGLNRFLTTGSRASLAGGTAALVMQNWSCGYYLLYFAPFVPAFVLYRMWVLGSLRAARTWISMSAAALTTLALSLPFLFPYRAAQEQFALERPIGEVIRFSATIWSYLTASENVRLYGGLLRFNLFPEGETFLGFVPWLLALVALGSVVLPLNAPAAPVRGSKALRIVTIVLSILAVSQFIAFVSAVMLGGFNVELFGIRIRATTPWRLALQLAIVSAVLLALSPRVRARLPQLARSPVVCFSIATLFAIWLSLGPMPNAGDGRAAGTGIYAVLYDYVPGFNGVRVPARYAMIAGLFLAVVAGFAARLLTFSYAVPIVAALVLAEGAAVPFEINRTWGGNEAMPPARVMPYAQAPPIYERVAALPEGSAITEFPFGDAAWEIRYVYYAAAHWKPITNGYSGGFPSSYRQRVARWRRVGADPDAAWQLLRDSGTTHVLVHRHAFARPEDADSVEAWLATHGATELERLPDGDILWAVN